MAFVFGVIAEATSSVFILNPQDSRVCTKTGFPSRYKKKSGTGS